MAYSAPSTRSHGYQVTADDWNVLVNNSIAHEDRLTETDVANTWTAKQTFSAGIEVAASQSINGAGILTISTDSGALKLAPSDHVDISATGKAIRWGSSGHLITTEADASLVVRARAASQGSTIVMRPTTNGTKPSSGQRAAAIEFRNADGSDYQFMHVGVDIDGSGWAGWVNSGAAGAASVRDFVWEHDGTEVFRVEPDAGFKHISSQIGFFNTSPVTQQNIPLTSPTVQNVIDALVALGLVEQSD